MAFCHKLRYLRGYDAALEWKRGDLKHRLWLSVIFLIALKVVPDEDENKKD